MIACLVIDLLDLVGDALPVIFGGALATFANYGLSNFAVSFVQRGFAVNIKDAASIYGLITGISTPRTAISSIANGKRSSR